MKGFHWNIPIIVNGFFISKIAVAEGLATKFCSPIKSGIMKKWFLFVKKWVIFPRPQMSYFCGMNLEIYLREKQYD